MAGQLDRSVFSASEFKLDLTIGEGTPSAKTYTDYGFTTATIPGMGEATTQEFKLNNEQRTVVTAPGVDNNFTFETSFTADFFTFRKNAKDILAYKAVLTGKEGSAFAGDTITIEGKVASPSDLAVGVDNVPVYTFNGTTAKMDYSAGA